MKISSCFKPLYLRAEDLGPGLHKRIIASVEAEYINEGDAEPLPVMRFELEDKGLILSPTNAWTLADQIGDETDNWIGVSVILRAVWSTHPWVKVDADPGVPRIVRKASRGTSKRRSK